MTIVEIIEEDLCGISCLYESLKVVISAMQGMPIILESGFMLGNANIGWFGYLMLYYGVWLVDDYVF